MEIDQPSPQSKTVTLQEWKDALLSGKYTQGISQLYDEQTNSYCCLGVLHSLITNNTWRTKENELPISLPTDGLLSETMWSEFITTNSKFYWSQFTLANANDSNKCFADIVKEFIDPVLEGADLNKF